MAALTLFVGIDPGKKGGIAVIDQFGARLQSREMPVTADGEIDVQGLREVLAFSRDEGLGVFVVIEKSQAMPGQGVVSMFKYGVGFGKIQAVVELMGLRHTYIRPQQWKREFGLLKTTKQDSARLALDMFPHFDQCTARGRLKDGEAEALLMAEYDRRYFQEMLK